MALLITGATGHIGSHIVTSAVRGNIEAIALYRGARPPTRDSGGVRWLQCEIADRDAVIRLAREHSITSCIHAAAVSNEARARPDPVGAVKVNIGATASLLEAAREHGWRRVILVSTGSVFQKRAMLGEPILEDAEPEPENVYSTTKCAAEMLCRMYRSEFGLSASAVRLSWVFGPPVVARDPARGPMPSLLIRALKGVPVDEEGGDFAASFTYVRDAADGLLAAATAGELRSPVYHLGPGRNFPLWDVASVIARTIPEARIKLQPGTGPWTTFTAARDPLAGSRLRQDTGFVPSYSLAAGLETYAGWLRSNPALWVNENP